MNIAVFLIGSLCILSAPGVDSEEVACPRRVSGAEYGEVSIKCYYATSPAANKYARKFCCLQGARPGRCRHTVVSDSGYAAGRFAERITLADTPEGGYFTVTIAGLRREDEGDYVCGIGTDTRGSGGGVRLTVITDPEATPPRKDPELLYVMLGGSAVFRCSGGSVGGRRFLCKTDANGCAEIIDSAGVMDPKYGGRILAGGAAAAFVVKMVQLRVEDAGNYVCRSDDPEEAKELPEFDLRINEESDIPQGSRLLTPRLGGSLSAQCRYAPDMKYAGKSWCKLVGGACAPIVGTDGYVAAAYEGRVLVQDDPPAGLMQLLLNGVSEEDAGWYWCVTTDGANEQTSVVEVRISREDLPGLSGNRFIEVTAGDPIRITCSYPCRLRDAEKYWCRWSSHGCEPLSTVEDTLNSQLVSCKTEDLVLTINSVSQAHSGFYWCGVKHGSRYGESIASRLKVVESKTKAQANFHGEPRIVQANVPPPSSGNKSSSVTAAVVSVCAAVVVVCAVFLFLRMRKRKNSDLVSVGSYRTNISLSDLDRNVGKENPGVTDLQETEISPCEDSPKTKKKGSQEDLEYSCFLINPAGNPNEQVAE